MPIRVFLFASLFFVVFFQSSSVAEEGDDEVLGRAGNFEVKLGEVRRSLSTLGETERAALLREPAALNQYVRALLVQQVVLSEAKKAGWEKSAVVAERMSALRD